MAIDEFGPLRRESKAARSRLMAKRRRLADGILGVDRQLAKVETIDAKLGDVGQDQEMAAAASTTTCSANREQVEAIVTTILRDNPAGVNAGDLKGLLYDKLREQGLDCKGAARILTHVLGSPAFEKNDAGEFRLAGGSPSICPSTALG